MDDRALRPVRDHDQVAVPAAEVVERGEHLGLFRTELGSTHPLLRLACRKIEVVHESLLALAGGCTEGVGGRHDHG